MAGTGNSEAVFQRFGIKLAFVCASILVGAIAALGIQAQVGGMLGTVLGLITLFVGGTVATFSIKRFQANLQAE